MGLDQYLYAEKFVGKGLNKELYGKVAEALGVDFPAEDFVPSITADVKVGYWRKANQIHQWFVDNVQNGEDNCAKYFVTRDKLEDLLITCKEVQATRNKEIAEELLPPQQGFFFGGYEIDDYYFEQIDYTVELLNRVLTTVPEDWDFSYTSSW